MREFSYENQGTSTWLIYDLSAEKIDTMSLGMITNNKITGIVPALYTQQDNGKYLKYNISARISLKQFFMGTVSKKRLLGVFTSIVSALMAAEEYMIDVGSILLDAEYIYVDVSSGKAELICVPVLNAEQPLRDMGAFFKNMMFCTQFDSGEDCDYVARIINYLNSAPVLSLSAFGSLLQELANMTMILTDRNPAQAASDSRQPPVGPGVSVQAASPSGNISPAVSLEQQRQPEVMQKQPEILHRQPETQPGILQTQPEVSQIQPEIPGLPAPPSMAIPPSVTSPPAQQPVPAAEGEKEISLFYLLQHYNKENAAAYKAQKDLKKESKKQKAGKASKQPKSPKAGKASKAQGTVSPQMQIPPQGAVPMQKTSPQMQIPSQGTPQMQGTPPAPSQGAVPPQMQPAQGSAAGAAAAPGQAQNMTLQDISYGARNGISGPIPQSGTGASIPQNGNFGETTVLSVASGETTVLRISPQGGSRQAYLVRRKTGEQILLNKPVFRVGKERSFVDYFIGDNTAVSRSHANFIFRDGAYFVEDTNSTNHTFINGAMIPSNTESGLAHGDKVTLADEEFEFRMM